MAKTSPKTRAVQASRTPQLLEVTDLTGGLDLRHSPTQMASNRAIRLLNYSLTNPGELTVRAGYLRFSTTNLGNSRIQGGQRVYLGSTQFSVLAWNGAIYSLSDAGVLDSTAVYSTLSPTQQVFFPYDRTLVAVLDATNRPRKSTDGLTWTRMGLDASTGISSLSSVANGSLSASEFEVTFSYKDRGLAHESNISTRVSTITLGATGAISVQTPNSSDPQTDAVILYARNKTAGETVLRKVSSGAMSSGASSTFVITSSAWSANDEAPTNHHPPEAYAFAQPWKNRWWAKDGTVGNRIHFTELFQNQSWPVLFYIDIPFERGDEITALVAQGDTLLVFGQSKVFLIIGQTSLDFEVRPSAGAQAGALGPRAVAAIENGVVHASGEGVFIFDGATDRYLTFDIEPAWRDLVRNSAATALALVAMAYHFPFKELRISVPRKYPTGAAGEFVLDLNRTRESETPAWTETDRTIGGYMLWDGDEPITGNRGRVLSWHPSTQGTVFEESTGTTANGANLTAEYEGPHFAMGLHRARIPQSFLEYEPHGGALTAELVTDGISDGSQNVSIGSGLSVYGTAVYGTGAYAGAGRKMTPLFHRLAAEGRTVWLKTSYTGQEAFKTFTYAFQIVPEPMPRGFGD